MMIIIDNDEDEEVPTGSLRNLKDLIEFFREIREIERLKKETAVEAKKILHGISMSFGIQTFFLGVKGANIDIDEMNRKEKEYARVRSVKFLRPKVWNLMIELTLEDNASFKGGDKIVIYQHDAIDPIQIKGTIISSQREHLTVEIPCGQSSHALVLKLKTNWKNTVRPIMVTSVEKEMNQNFLYGSTLSRAKKLLKSNSRDGTAFKSLFTEESVVDSRFNLQPENLSKQLTNGIDLDSSKEQAVCNTANFMVSSILGAAGTGKSHTLSAVVSTLFKFHLNKFGYPPRFLIVCGSNTAVTPIGTAIVNVVG